MTDILGKLEMVKVTTILGRTGICRYVVVINLNATFTQVIQINHI
jgi:hypothetical protein